MSLSFPANPTLGQGVTVAGALWTFNGTGWSRDEGGTRPLKTINGQSLAGTGNIKLTPADIFTDDQLTAGAQNVLALDASQRLVTGGGAIRRADYFMLPSVVDVTRNSLNDASDAVEVTMATFVIPGNLLSLGSAIEVWTLFENSNSALTKSLSIRCNGTAIGGFTNTTQQAYALRYPVHIHDANTVIAMNNGTAGTGSAAGVVLSHTVPGVLTNGFTITLTGRWTAAALGEFIRVKHAKIKLM